jgi:hypothetical protein
MSLRPTTRSRSQTLPAPTIYSGTNLHRITTPLDHIDSFIIDEHDHNPLESAEGTPRTSMTLVNRGEGVERIEEEGHEHEHEMENGWNAADGNEKGTRRTDGKGNSGIQRKLTGSLRPSESRANEKQNVSPEEREWKDDIVTFDSKVRPFRPFALVT